MQPILARINENRIPIGLVILGILLIGIGGAKMVQESRGEELIITDPAKELTQDQTVPKTILVDVGGAVASPSVYRLDAGARVTDAIQAAGGLDALADSGWVGRNLNQAEAVKDGMKIYIPVLQEAEGSIEENVNQVSDKVNINTATEAELDMLWGIGSTRAQAIISNRPYQDLSELTAKAGIPATVIEKNQNKISW